MDWPKGGRHRCSSCLRTGTKYLSKILTGAPLVGVRRRKRATTSHAMAPTELTYRTSCTWYPAWESCARSVVRQGAVVVLDVLQNVDQYRGIEGALAGRRIDASVQHLHGRVIREPLAQYADASSGYFGSDDSLGFRRQ